MRITLIIALIFTATFCRAQQRDYTAFTVNNGLPSNYVYRCVEDNKGFLWIATDAGVARFDGRYFQVFTTKEGLPDNEVLSIVKENDGRIWVNCFKQSPAYFDDVKNRFINVNNGTSVAKLMQSASTTTLFRLVDGGVMYVNEYGSFVFKNKLLVKSYTSPSKDNFLIRDNNDGSELRYGWNLIDTAHKLSGAYLFDVHNNKNIDSLLWRYETIPELSMPVVHDSDLYILYPSRHSFYRLSNLHSGPISFTVDSGTVSETFFYYGFTGKWIALYSYSGRIYVYDAKTLQPKFNLAGNYIPNAIYKDNRENLWVTTIDKGLMLYKTKGLGHVTLPAGFTNTDFLSIYCKPDGILLAGNYSGQVLEVGKQKSKIYPCPQKNVAILRERKILVSQNKIFTFSENGIFINNLNPIIVKNGFAFGKTAITISDSIILVGATTGLTKLNTITNSVHTLRRTGRRVTAMAKAPGNLVYFGSTDGLYKYSYAKDTLLALSKSQPLLANRVTGLCSTPDSLLWLSTASDGVLAVKNDKVIFHIVTKNGLIDDVTRSIATGRPGQIWVGTSAGISVINYTLQQDKIACNTQNLSVNDGLTSNVINEMTYHNDTMYAATADGISIIPADISFPKFNIPVQLVRMSIEQHDTIISSYYRLPYNDRNIQMQLAGIELGGHFKNLQYTVDNNTNWVDLGQNTLALQLNSGNHTVQVRAVDVNGNISDKILSVRFDIATPFWKAIWFWILVAVLLQLLTLYYLNRWFKKRREQKLAAEMAVIQTAALEQQAFTSLINPHFIFNALNSIQHYINLQDRKSANRYLSDFASLIRKNFEAAQKSFIALEEELENIKIYLRLEQMRFNGRFTYRVDIAENAEVEEWMIPTMMLQPFLENALLHGIMPSTIEGEIVVDIEEQGGYLLITIIDNGIGIANSKALKGGNGHNSLGMELIQKRVDALSRVSENSIKIRFSPATEDNKNPGTKIILLIHAGLYDAWLGAQKQ